MLLLALLIFVYALIGKQQFGGKWAFTAAANQEEPQLARANFDTMWESLYTTFQLLTCKLTSLF